MKLRSERPWRRSLIKILLLILRGKSRAHAQDAWPGLALNVPRSEDSVGDVNYRGASVAPLSHPMHLRSAGGKEIHIIGSGPSISDNDLKTVPFGSTILLNGAISLLKREINQPLAVAVEDERFVWRHFSLMREMIAEGTVCLLSVSVIRAICEIDSTWLGDKTVILIDDIRKPYGGARRRGSDLTGLDFVTLSPDGATGFSHDPSRGVFQGGSVVVSVLQFAIFCKPKQIGLFGIDIVNADMPRFYEGAGETAQSGVGRARDRILSHVNVAKSVCEEQGIELLNFSPVSALREIGLPYDHRFAAEAVTLTRDR